MILTANQKTDLLNYVAKTFAAASIMLDGNETQNNIQIQNNILIPFYGVVEYLPSFAMVLDQLNSYMWVYLNDPTQYTTQIAQLRAILKKSPPTTSFAKDAGVISRITGVPINNITDVTSLSSNPAPPNYPSMFASVTTFRTSVMSKAIAYLGSLGINSSAYSAESLSGVIRLFFSSLAVAQSYTDKELNEYIRASGFVSKILADKDRLALSAKNIDNTLHNKDVFIGWASGFLNLATQDISRLDNIKYESLETLLRVNNTALSAYIQPSTLFKNSIYSVSNNGKLFESAPTNPSINLLYGQVNTINNIPSISLFFEINQEDFNSKNINSLKIFRNKVASAVENSDVTEYVTIDFQNFIDTKLKTKQSFAANNQSFTFFWTDTSVEFGYKYKYSAQLLLSNGDGSWNLNTSNKTSEIIVSPTKYQRPPKPLSFSKFLINQEYFNFRLAVADSSIVKRIHVYQKYSYELSFKKVSVLTLNSNPTIFNDTAFTKEGSGAVNFPVLKVSGYQYVVYRFFIEDNNWEISDPFETAPDLKFPMQLPISPEFNMSIRDDGVYLTLGASLMSGANIGYFKIQRGRMSGNSVVDYTIVKDKSGSSIFYPKFIYVKNEQRFDKKYEDIVINDVTAYPGFSYMYWVEEYSLSGYSVKSLMPFRFNVPTNYKALLSPTFLKHQVLTVNPFRVLIYWNDDNKYDSSNEGFVRYKIKRTNSLDPNDTQYFYTRTSYFIDEINSSKPVYSNITKFNQLFVENTEKNVSLEYLKSKDYIAALTNDYVATGTYRAGVPSFMIYNYMYNYSVSVVYAEIPGPDSLTIQFPVFPLLKKPILRSNSSIVSRTRPNFVRLVWDISTDGIMPEYFLIERKLAIASDIYIKIGKSYVENQFGSVSFTDISTELNRNYLYRVSSIDSAGRVDSFIEIGANT